MSSGRKRVFTRPCGKESPSNFPLSRLWLGENVISWDGVSVKRDDRIDFAISERQRFCVNYERSTEGNEPTMRHVLSALVQNLPGVLSHVAGMLASRGFNIDSLAVGETESPDISRMVFVVRGDAAVLNQVRRQLEKLVTVVRVENLSEIDFVERDLMLLKVDVPEGRRSEMMELVEIFRGRVVDVSPRQMMIEISGKESKVEAFVEVMRPFGIVELARTGRIAMPRTMQLEGR